MKRLKRLAVHLVMLALGVVIGIVLWGSLASVRAAPLPNPSIEAFTIVVNAILSLFATSVAAIVSLFGQAALNIIQAFAAL